jgi:hypothetical protein
MLGDDLIRVATLARNRKSCTGVAATKGRHLGFAPDEANRRGGVPFLEKWGGSLAVQPRWQRRTNVWREVTNPERGPRRLMIGNQVDNQGPRK